MDADKDSSISILFATKDHKGRRAKKLPFSPRIWISDNKCSSVVNQTPDLPWITPMYTDKFFFPRIALMDADKLLFIRAYPRYPREKIRVHSRSFAVKTFRISAQS
jgi:hypothetical protein